MLYLDSNYFYLLSELFVNMTSAAGSRINWGREYAST